MMYVLMIEDVPLMELMYLVFTRMPGETYRRRLGSLLYLCYVFPALITPLCVERSGPRSVSDLFFVFCVTLVVLFLPNVWIMQ